MKSRHAIYSFIILIIILLLYFLDLKLSEYGKLKDITNRKLTQINYEDITSFSLKNDFGEMRFEKKGDDWFIIKPIQIKADKTAVETTLTNLTAGRKRSIQSIDKSKLSDYGIDKPKYSITLISKSKPKEETIILGADSPIPYQLYAKSSLSDEIFSVSNNIKNSLNKPPTNFRNRSLLKTPILNVLEMAFISGDSKIIVSKTENDLWKITSPIEEEADNDFIQDLSTKIANYKISSFIDSPENLAKYNLEKPPFVLQLKLADKSDLSLMIGKFDSDTESYYCKTDKGDEIFTISKEFGDLIQANLFQLRNKKFFSIPKENINELDFIIGENKLYLRNIDKKWIIKDEQDVKLDQEKITKLISLLDGIKAIGFKNDNPSAKELEDYRLKDPKETIRISDGKTEQILHIGKKPVEENVVFCKKEGSPIIYNMDWQAVGLLFVEKEDVLDKSIMSLDPLLITRFVIKTESKEFTIVKNTKEGKWDFEMLPDKLKYSYLDADVRKLFSSILTMKYEYLTNEALNVPDMTGVNNPTFEIMILDENNKILIDLIRGDIQKGKTFVEVDKKNLYIVNNTHFSNIESALSQLIR